MTLTEAKTQWKVSYETICLWLDKGFIPDTQLVDGAVVISGTQPFVPKKGVSITVENVRKYILQACMNFGYVDYRILCIPQEQFRAILLQLEDKRYIQRNFPEPDCLSNKHFTITEEGETFLNKGKFQLEKLGFTFKFKYLDVNVEIGKDK